MVVTLFPMVTEAKEEHLQNVSSSIEVTLLGMVTEVKEEHL
jgi:hypothetical protein